MKETRGDLWERQDADALVVLTNGVVTNGALVMGGGVAREASDRFAPLAVVWGQDIINHGLHVCAYETGLGPALVAFPTKRHWRDPSDLDLIAQSASELVDLTNHRGWGTVVLPRPGCGLGGLKWENVRPILELVLDDRFYVITNT